MTDTPDIEDLILEGRRRYHTDAEFHCEVKRAVYAAMNNVFFRDPQAERVAQAMAIDAVLLALHLRDEGVPLITEQKPPSQGLLDAVVIPPDERLTIRSFMGALHAHSQRNRQERNER